MRGKAVAAFFLEGISMQRVKAIVEPRFIHFLVVLVIFMTLNPNVHHSHGKAEAAQELISGKDYQSGVVLVEFELSEINRSPNTYFFLFFLFFFVRHPALFNLSESIFQCRIFFLKVNLAALNQNVRIHAYIINRVPFGRKIFTRGKPKR